MANRKNEEWEVVYALALADWTSTYIDCNEKALSIGVDSASIKIVC